MEYTFNQVVIQAALKKSIFCVSFLLFDGSFYYSNYSRIAIWNQIKLNYNQIFCARNI